jgi:hypothetical protein
VAVEAAVKSALGLKIKDATSKARRKLETDLLIGLHGRNKNAEEKKERRSISPTKLSGSGKDAKSIAGKVYRLR